MMTARQRLLLDLCVADGDGARDGGIDEDAVGVRHRNGRTRRHGPKVSAGQRDRFAASRVHGEGAAQP